MVRVFHHSAIYRPLSLSRVAYRDHQDRGQVSAIPMWVGLFKIQNSTWAGSFEIEILNLNLNSNSNSASGHCSLLQPIALFIIVGSRSFERLVAFGQVAKEYGVPRSCRNVGYKEARSAGHTNQVLGCLFSLLPRSDPDYPSFGWRTRGRWIYTYVYVYVYSYA